jgi:AcrR family transcriptional regulator
MPNKELRLPGRRSRAESARTRARVLDRAERLFAEKGYAGTSLRQLARDCGVRPFAIQHHFGSKLALYQVVLCRWDGDVLERVSRALGHPVDFPTLVEGVIDELFDFFLERRDWMALNARAGLGEGLPPGVALEDRGWVRFMAHAMRGQGIPGPPVDFGLLLITIEGILNNHVLSQAHYRQLFGRDVTDPGLKRRTKVHLKRVILALLGQPAGAAARTPRRTSGRMPWESSTPTKA